MYQKSHFLKYDFWLFKFYHFLKNVVNFYQPPQSKTLVKSTFFFMIFILISHQTKFSEGNNTLQVTEEKIDLSRFHKISLYLSRCRKDWQLCILTLVFTFRSLHFFCHNCWFLCFFFLSQFNQCYIWFTCQIYWWLCIFIISNFNHSSF